jgi:hypothetical protein
MTWVFDVAPRAVKGGGIRVYDCRLDELYEERCDSAIRRLRSRR